MLGSARWLMAAVTAAALASACELVGGIHDRALGGGGAASASSSSASTGGSGGAPASSSASTAASSSSSGPILGDDVEEPQVDFHADWGLADASDYYAAADGEVKSLTVYYSGGSSKHLIVGLYDTKNAHPHQLLGRGDIPSAKGGTWNTATLAAAVPVKKGVRYWIALVSPRGAGSFSFPFAYDMGSPNPWTEHSAQGENGAPDGLVDLPATWTPGAVFPNTRCSFYAGG